jgi:hypothetical protein
VEPPFFVRACGVATTAEWSPGAACGVGCRSGWRRDHQRSRLGDRGADRRRRGRDRGADVSRGGRGVRSGGFLDRRGAASPANRSGGAGRRSRAGDRGGRRGLIGGESRSVAGSAPAWPRRWRDRRRSGRSGLSATAVCIDWIGRGFGAVGAHAPDQGAGRDGQDRNTDQERQVVGRFLLRRASIDRLARKQMPKHSESVVTTGSGASKFRAGRSGASGGHFYLRE